MNTPKVRQETRKGWHSMLSDWSVWWCPCARVVHKTKGDPMVATMNTIRTRRRIRGRVKQTSERMISVLMFLLLFVVQGNAQNFINRGRFVNAGLFKVKNAALGLPDSVKGIFEYFGDNQTVAGRFYTNLNLGKPIASPNAVKTADSSLTVDGTIAVADAVTFRIPSNFTMTLESVTGRLTENGYVSGRIQKTENLTGSSGSSDFGGMGAELSWNGTAPGPTNITRMSDTVIVVGGKSSIRRYIDIHPSVDTALNAIVTFKYAPDEVGGMTPGSFDLWRWPDNGNEWRRQRVTVDQLQRSITRSGINSITGRWTAADAANSLGNAKFEWEADSIRLLAGDRQRGRPNTLLPLPLKLKLMDYYGQPIVQSKITFSIGSAPDGASGQQLSDTSVHTNTNGEASVLFTLGSLRGKYRIVARTPDLPNDSLVFDADAGSAVATIPSIAGDGQVDTVKKMLLPLTIQALDDSLIAVSGAEIHFEIDSVPANAMGYMLSKLVDTSDANGHASTVITLGNKVGKYRVKVTSPETDSVTYFTFTASHGLPALAWQDNIMRQDTIGAPMPEFTYRITDSDTNAVAGRTVKFTLKRPDNVDIDSMSTVTDTLGQASANFAYATIVGNYTISAKDASFAGLERFFTAKATHGKVTRINTFMSSVTDTIGTTLPPFGVSVADRGDNPVDSVMVKFILNNPGQSVQRQLSGLSFAKIVVSESNDHASSQSGVLRTPKTHGTVDADGSGQLAAGAIGHLSADSLRTDSLGRAPVQLTLGDTVGTYGVQATFTTIPAAPQSFAFNATHGVAQKLLMEHGQNQSKEILQPLDVPFEVRLTDRASNPISNDTVFFALAAAPPSATGYLLSSSIALTDIEGLASIRLTLGNKIGPYTVTATSHTLSLPVSFSATASHGSAKWIATASSPDTAKKPILTVLDTLAVRLTDIGGNPVPGSAVTFALTDTPSGAWGYQLSRDTVWTDVAGEAKTVLTLGSRIGRYSVTARTPALPSDSLVRFDAIALVGTPKSLAQESGDGQVGQIGNQVNPFVVQVSDTGGNLVPSAVVRFAVIERPDTLAKFDTLSRSIDTTDAFGRASTVLTLGNRTGRYKVQASIPGVRDTIFSVDAIMLMADVNNDNFLNIGDLTAIIDHILGRIVLNEYQFKKADMYPIHSDGTPPGDGVVDIRDVQVCLDSLLADKWVPTYDWTQTPVTLSKKVSGSAAAAGAGSPLFTSLTDSCNIQTTHIGSRFSLKNSEPIKGLQAVIYMKNAAVLDTADVVFERAKMMRADVKSTGKEVSVILWNANNIPIEPGDSAIFRLPIQLTNNNVDSINVLISTGSNNVVSMINSKQTDIRNSIPRDWMLYQNYPNPFNPSTTIEFDVPEVAGKLPRIAIQIFNILGQKVRTIERGIYDAGRYSVVWDGKSENGARIASGVYFYRLLAGEYASTKKMVMLK